MTQWFCIGRQEYPINISLCIKCTRVHDERRLNYNAMQNCWVSLLQIRVLKCHSFISAQSIVHSVIVSPLYKSGIKPNVRCLWPNQIMGPKPEGNKIISEGGLKRIQKRAEWRFAKSSRDETRAKGGWGKQNAFDSEEPFVNPISRHQLATWLKFTFSRAFA